MAEPRVGRVHNSTHSKDGNFYGVGKFSLVKLGFRNGVNKIAAAIFASISIPWLILVMGILNLKFTTGGGVGGVLMVFPPVILTWLILNKRDERDKVSLVDSTRFKVNHRLNEPKTFAGNQPTAPSNTLVVAEFVTPRPLYSDH